GMCEVEAVEAGNAETGGGGVRVEDVVEESGGLWVEVRLYSSDSLLQIAQHRRRWRDGINSILLHFLINAMCIVEDTFQCDGFTQSRVGNVNDSQTNSVCFIEKGSVIYALQLCGNGGIGLPKNPIHDGFVDTNDEGLTLICGEL
ncbi:hypothetical protein KEM55_007610, partial [Ascosphaera atra]